MESNARKLSALAVLGAFAFFSPVAGAFNRATTFLGVPVLPAYLFGVWGLLVFAAWWVFRRQKP